MPITIFVTVTGSTQGTFKGSGTTKQGEGKISVLGFELGVLAQIDPATGQSSGKRQHKPIVLTKEVDASSPQFFQAIVTNEVLKTVVFEFMKTSPKGLEVVDHTISLVNCVIGSFNDSVHLGQQGGPVIDTRELEQISLTYQKITMVNIPGGTQASDDWLII